MPKPAAAIVVAVTTDKKENIQALGAWMFFVISC